MRASIRGAAALLFLILCALFYGQCFAPSYADCAFRCGPTAPVCPDEYECRADGYCHLRDTDAVCASAPDLVGDLSGDLSGDLAGMTSADLAAAGGG